MTDKTAAEQAAEELLRDAAEIAKLLRFESAIIGRMRRAATLMEQQAKRIAELEAERRVLAQAMWDARKELGYDNDGDPTPNACLTGMGVQWFSSSHVSEARQMRADYEAEIGELLAVRGAARVEWGVQRNSGTISDHGGSKRAVRQYVAELNRNGVVAHLVRRTVTPWAPVGDHKPQDREYRS